MEETTTNLTKQRIAFIVSWVFHPSLLSFVSSIAIVRELNIPVATFIQIVSPTFLFISIYVLVNVVIKKKADIEFIDVRQRPPLLITSLLGLMISFIIANSVFPELIPLLTKLLIIVIIFTAISFYWKVSFHALFLSMTVFLLASFYGQYLYILFVLLPFVFWSRIVLRKHKLEQLIVGAILGIIIII